MTGLGFVVVVGPTLLRATGALLRASRAGSHAFCRNVMAPLAQVEEFPHFVAVGSCSEGTRWGHVARGPNKHVCSPFSVWQGCSRPMIRLWRSTRTGPTPCTTSNPSQRIRILLRNNFFLLIPRTVPLFRHALGFMFRVSFVRRQQCHTVIFLTSSDLPKGNCLHKQIQLQEAMRRFSKLPPFRHLTLLLCSVSRILSRNKRVFIPS